MQKKGSLIHNRTIQTTEFKNHVNWKKELLTTLGCTKEGLKRLKYEVMKRLEPVGHIAASVLGKGVKFHKRNLLKCK